MQVIKVKSNTIFPVIADLLHSGQTARITVTGRSMSPFLKEGRDNVELSKTSFQEIRKGDIVLVKRTNGIYVLHRVYKKTEASFFMVGDAQQWIEGPLYPEQLAAKVVSVRRKNRDIPCTNKGWRFLSWVWLRLRVFRYKIFKVYSIMKKCWAKPNNEKLGESHEN